MCVNTHRESTTQLIECLTRVRTNLADARVHVFVNGDNADHIAVATQLGCTAERVTNFGNNYRWYLWWRRMLEWFVSTEAEVFLKLDPDTMVDAPIAALPTDDYFGCIDDWFVQGGAVGLSRQLAQRVLADNLLSRTTCGSLR